MDEITQEQMEVIQKYRDEYLGIGLSTEPADKESAEEAIKRLYTLAGEKLSEDKPFIWTESPDAACGLIAVLDTDTEESEEWLAQFADNGRYIVPSKAIQEYMEEHKVPFKYYRTNFWGQQEAYWVAFYLCGKELGVEYDAEDEEKLLLWDKICRSVNWWWAFEGTAVCCERPAAIHQEDAVLHKDMGKAIEYRDGWGIYAMHGIAVPEWLATTPKDELDPLQLMRIDNAEIRREFVAKVGMDRILEKHDNKLIDEDSANGFTYQLVSLDTGDHADRRFLKMQNASAHLHKHLNDIWHIEGVPPETKTVQEALAFRNGRDDNPAILT